MFAVILRLLGLSTPIRPFNVIINCVCDVWLTTEQLLRLFGDNNQIWTTVHLKTSPLTGLKGAHQISFIAPYLYSQHKQ